MGPAYAADGVAPNKPAVVKNTGGGAVRFREGAGAGYDVKGTLGEGDQVFVLEGPVKDKDGARWYRVQVGSRVGWMSADYLGSATSKITSTKTDTKAAATTSSKTTAKPAAKLGAYAKVTNSDGDAVRLRSTPGGKVIATAGAGTVLTVSKGPVKDKSGVAWYQVSGTNMSGWMLAEYLASAPAPKSTAKASTSKTTAKATTKTTTTATARTGTARGAEPAAAARPSSAGGVIGVAMSYVGARYRFGGTTPSGFDCSGFVYYVFNKAGISMSRSMGAQLASGTRISSSQLQAGDLVYFSNTYKRGISHIAIYIGNGRMVHAADYGVGVTVSDLWSSYWAAHYTGAIRISR